MFCDELKIEVIAGKGGNGAATFRREKFVPRGGPDGGDGGRGGDIILKVNPHLNTLSSLANQKIYRAHDGTNGMRKNMHGANADHFILEVPKGTMIFNDDKSQLLADLKQEGDTFVLVHGGRGGKGNARFVSSTHQAPRFAEKGEPGESKIICLELKLVADIGIIGLPSAGKSTLISVISNAKPKIAAYHFTTLVPNLGVVDMRPFGAEGTFVVADIPGLIEGASEGKGLGHQFLRHIKRNNVLVHLVDGSEEDIVASYNVVRNELARFDAGLSKKKEILVLNKIDLLDADQLKEKEKALKKASKAKKIFKIAAAAQIGVKELVFALFEQYNLDRSIVVEDSLTDIEEEKVAVLRPHLKEAKFEIEKVVQKKDRKIFRLKGARIEQLIQMTDTTNLEGLERVYHYLGRMGAMRAIERLGATYGDEIKILNVKIPYRK